MIFLQNFAAFFTSLAIIFTFAYLFRTIIQSKKEISKLQEDYKNTFSVLLLTRQSLDETMPKIEKELKSLRADIEAKKEAPVKVKKVSDKPRWFDNPERKAEVSAKIRAKLAEKKLLKDNVLQQESKIALSDLTIPEPKLLAESISSANVYSKEGFPS